MSEKLDYSKQWKNIYLGTGEQRHVHLTAESHKLETIYLSFNQSWTSNKRSHINQKEELLTPLTDQRILSTHFVNLEFLSGHY